jgi:hypothetical protein
VGIAPVKALAECPLDPADLRRELDAAYSEYTDLDFDGFRARFTGVREEVSCLSATLDGDEAAQLHFAHALDAFLDRDQDRMLRAIRGVLAADPDYSPSSDVVRPGNGLFVAFELARQPREPVTEPLPAGSYVVDGAPGSEAAPMDRNAVVHRVDTQAVHSWYLDAPVLPLGLAPEVEPLAPAPLARRSRRSRALLGAGAGLGIAAGASLAAAAVLKDRYYDEEDPPGNPEAVKAANLATGITGWTLATGAAGLGAAAMITWEW